MRIHNPVTSKMKRFAKLVKGSTSQMSDSVLNAPMSLQYNSHLFAYVTKISSYFLMNLFRSSHQRCSRRCSLRFCKIHKKTPVPESFFIKACSFIKERLWHRCFLVNVAKFLRSPFLQKISGRLLLFRSLFGETRLDWIQHKNQLRQLTSKCSQKKLQKFTNLQKPMGKFFRYVIGNVSGGRTSAFIKPTPPRNHVSSAVY